MNSLSSWKVQLQKLVILKPFIFKLLNLNETLFISKELDDKKLESVTTYLPPTLKGLFSVYVLSYYTAKNYSFRQALKIFSTQLIWIIIQTLTDKATWGCLSSWLHQSMAIFLTASRGATDNFRQVRPHYHCGLAARSLRILFRQIKVRPSSCRFYLRRRPWPLLPTASNRIEYNTLNST